MAWTSTTILPQPVIPVAEEPQSSTTILLMGFGFVLLLFFLMQAPFGPPTPTTAVTSPVVVPSTPIAPIAPVTPVPTVSTPVTPLPAVSPVVLPGVRRSIVTTPVVL